MTNFEWLKSLNVDELAEWVGTVASGDVYDDIENLKNFVTWCQKDGCCGGNCDSCIKEWLETERTTPMPVLENGNFVSVKLPVYGEVSNYEIQIGVIVRDNIIYQNGRFNLIDKVRDKIVKVYNAKCFDGCDEFHVVWRKL